MTNRIEDYLDNLNTNKLHQSIKNTWEYFGYPNHNIFSIDLELLLDTVYNDIKLIKDSKVRLEQTEFRNNLIKYYNSKCVITMNDSPEELEAAHIHEIKDGGDYSLDNGLLLECNLHRTFDKYSWAINPNTLTIEINPNSTANTIKKYIGKKVNIQINPFLYTNLKFRYEKFIEKMNENK